MADPMEYATEVGKRSIHVLPTGTITLLFTDIEQSTYLLQQLGNRYANVLDEYRHLLRMAFQQWSGHEVYTQGGWVLRSLFSRQRCRGSSSGSPTISC